MHDPFVCWTPDRADERGLHPVGHGVHRSDVVTVEVREDEQVDAVDAEQVEARPEPFGVVPGVHHGDSRSGRPAHQNGVPLTDVARRHCPVRRQTGAHDDPGHGDHDHPDDEDGARQQQETEADPSRHEDGDGEAHADDRSRDDAADAGRPRSGRVGQGSRPVGDPADRAGGDPGDRGQHPSAPGPDRCRDAGRESHDGDDRRERFGQEVRRHRVRRERRGQRDRHRPARQLRRHGDRQRGCERCPHAPREQCGQRWTEHDDPGRRQHGQREGEGPREPGVGHQHPDHGEGDQRHAPHRTPGQVDGQHHDGHHRGPDDRRVRSHEHDEREEERHGESGTDASRESHHTTEHHHQADDHRAVRARDGGEVRQRRGLHRGLGGGVEPAPVADRQPPQQGAARLGQRGGDLDERPPRAVGRGEQPGRRFGLPRRAQERDERRGTAGLVRLQRGRRPQPCPRCEGSAAAVGRRDGTDRDPEPGDVPGPLERPEDGPIRGAEVTSEDDLHLDRPGARTVGSERRRTPPRLAHDHRDRQQRAEHRGRHDEPEDHTSVEAADTHHHDGAAPGDDRARDDRPDRDARRADQHRDQDPRRRDRDRHAEVGRAGGQVHRHGPLRPGRGRGGRRTGRHRSR